MQTIPTELKTSVLEDMRRYFDEYEEPAPGSTYGVPWSKVSVGLEIEKMSRCVVDPFVTEYLVKDTSEQLKASPPIRRPCWVVAIDGSYGLLFDSEAGDFVLACRSTNDEWGTIGIRGDAVTTFLAR